MSRLRATLIALSPLVLGLLVVAAMVATGERRELVTSTPIPLLVALLALALSVILGLIVLALRRQRVGRERVENARSTGERAGRADERDAHRRFLARLDHELKNPVTAIRATLAGIAPTEPHDEALVVIDGQAQRLAALVGDLRELAELETRPLELETIDLESVVRDAVAAVAQQRPTAADRLTVTVDRVPWPIPALLADPDLLGLAIENVVGNAAKFSTEGPIEIRLREDGGHAVVEVADTGRGIPVTAVDLVWDELARADNARDVPGSGIGLSLVRAILRQHGGDVSLRSVEGAGTVVTLRVPTTKRV